MPMSRSLFIAIFTVVFILAGRATASAQSCDQTVSVGANVASLVASAPNGSTLCLDSGDYGTVNLTNLNRTGWVTVRSTTGQGARMSIGEIYGTEFVRFVSLTFRQVIVRECSTDIEFLDSTWLANGQGLAFNYTMPCSQTDMRLVVDNCVFDRIQNTVAEGRLSIRKVRGLTIRNSRFTGVPTSNASDGIQIYDGASNVTIGPGNLFSGILQDQCGAVHCDAIQAYGGGAGTVITGNYFINSTVYIGIYDGGSPNAVIANNVFDTNPGGQALQIGGIQGMRMEHNTFRGITLGIGTKFANIPHSGWIVQNNIFDNARFTASGDQPGCGSDCVVRYNLKSNGGTTTPTGTNSITGNAAYVGAGTPTTWSSWQLASGSPGKVAGNDGADMGTLYYGSSTAPPPPPPPTAPAAPTNLRIIPPS